MPFEQTPTGITAKLRQGKFPNEQSSSQDIVLRILQELGWDIYDPTAVWPEYQTGGTEPDETPLSYAATRTDFALCHPLTKPAEFIEVKPPSKAEDSIRQAHTSENGKR